MEWLVIAHVKLFEGAMRGNCITTMDSYSYAMEQETQSVSRHSCKKTSETCEKIVPPWFYFYYY